MHHDRTAADGIPGEVFSEPEGCDREGVCECLLEGVVVREGGGKQEALLCGHEGCGGGWGCGAA